ncbi:MAG: hypothetical protein AAF899_06470 [Pseudomonadota bacterium]
MTFSTRCRAGFVSACVVSAGVVSACVALVATTASTASLNDVDDLAQNLCARELAAYVGGGYTLSDMEADAEARAALKRGLLRLLGELGLEGSVVYREFEEKGLPAAEIGRLIAETIQCRTRVLEIVAAAGALGADAPRTPPPGDPVPGSAPETETETETETEDPLQARRLALYAPFDHNWICTLDAMEPGTARKVGIARLNFRQPRDAGQLSWGRLEDLRVRRRSIPTEITFDTGGWSFIFCDGEDGACLHLDQGDGNDWIAGFTVDYDLDAALMRIDGALLERRSGYPPALRLSGECLPRL